MFFSSSSSNALLFCPQNCFFSKQNKPKNQLNLFFIVVVVCCDLEIAKSLKVNYKNRNFYLMANI